MGLRNLEGRNPVAVRSREIWINLRHVIGSDALGSEEEEGSFHGRSLDLLLEPKQADLLVKRHQKAPCFRLHQSSWRIIWITGEELPLLWFS